jgi:hypothetical protein
MKMNIVGLTGRIIAFEKLDSNVITWTFEASNPHAYLGAGAAVKKDVELLDMVTLGKKPVAFLSKLSPGLWIEIRGSLVRHENAMRVRTADGGIGLLGIALEQNAT